MEGSLEGQDDIFDNSPIIIKDNYQVSGSDMAQIGWVEVTTENGATGYLWYIKSEHETRLRFEDLSVSADLIFKLIIFLLTVIMFIIYFLIFFSKLQSIPKKHFHQFFFYQLLVLVLAF